MRFIVLESPMTALLDGSPMYFFSTMLPPKSSTTCRRAAARRFVYDKQPGFVVLFSSPALWLLCRFLVCLIPAAMSDVSVVDVSTCTEIYESVYSAGMQPPRPTGARRAFSEPARGNASAMCAAPEMMIPWDDSKRRLPLNSPTGASPAAKKIMRWSQADDQVLLKDLMPEMAGSSATPPHVHPEDHHPEDNLSEASDDTAPNNAMDYIDFAGGSSRKELPQYYDAAGFVACEPTVDCEFSGKKEVPMWTVEEDLLILQLVEHHGKRWSKIAAHLPGRTDNGVRNRWNRMEKAQTLRHRHGAEHGYRCRRCGQPKRGHICAALTRGDMPEGDNLAIKAAELTALSAQKMQAMLAGKQAGGRGMPPMMRSSRSMPDHRMAPMPNSVESLKPLGLSPLKKQPTDIVKLEGKAPQSKQQAEPLVEMDEVQLDDFLTELHLSLATPTNADRMQHAAAVAAGQHAASMAAAGHHAAAFMAGQRAAAMAAGFTGSLPSPVQSVPTMPPPSAHRYHPHFTGAPAACISAAPGSAPPAAGPSALARLYPPNFFYAHHGSPGTGHFLSRGGSADTCGDSEDLAASMLLNEPTILPQPSTDTMLANALPAVSLAGSFGNRSSRGEDGAKTNGERGNGLNKPKLSIEC
jgi:hypothetical protein